MGYRNLLECVHDLERHGELIRIDREIDPSLEVGAVQRRVYRAGGPALLFTRVKGCDFPMLANLFGTRDRIRFLFRDTLKTMEKIAGLRRDPWSFLRDPLGSAVLPVHAYHLLPSSARNAPVLANRTTIGKLPQLRSWPDDGGAYITLPQVYTECPATPGWRRSNLGMYRIQLSGGRYQPDEEVGIHYQIHRGIAAHHAEAIRMGVPLKVNIFVGGPPALTVAAVMPLPEGMPEIAFAGLLGGRRMRMTQLPGLLPIPAEADFCIVGEMDPERTLPEGPFGDHIGYYSLTHDFPVIRVKSVFHRPGAIWPFTTVGRPPQEDSEFGAFIHELTAPLISTVIPGVHAVHAVDAAGVHALLLAIGSERYVPYRRTSKPQELLTLANAILGQGQLSLAKYLLLAAEGDNPRLAVTDIAAFLQHILERVDWRRDLHFHTCTTIDTLDYSGSGLNEGSKVVIAATGPPIRSLPATLPADLRLPADFADPRVCLPGVLIVRGPACREYRDCLTADMAAFCAFYGEDGSISSFPLVVIVDDSDFTARTLENFLWVTFTRSNPAADIYGIGAFLDCKHWGCRGPLVIDARRKPHHAPPLVDDPEIEKRVDALGAPGGPLHGIL
ncbi:MAG: UbiD family decarboxylase [Deltaproteobacteria bacterium]|nr:UbiD family decarboxylase [Deltaproteobacteria bacterium]